jgi:hypothetical protein
MCIRDRLDPCCLFGQLRLLDRLHRFGQLDR